ncbi:MAG: hypothetical protein CM15mV72_590 [uncultured marine virus]|nr:MAG: hypothetical protein CM15mV72_590 [uncultured marine virus]
MRGVSLKYLVMDEYADMKPEVWEQILRPALADQKGEGLFIGTPMAVIIFTNYTSMLS